MGEKKYISIKKIALLLVVLLVFYACEKPENQNKIPDDLPRFNDLKESYKSILTSADRGWIVSYQPSADAGVFHILMEFREDGTVIINSDLNNYTTTADDVFYDVKGATYPELVFETFCVWHQIYEVAEGEFQFRILTIDENSVELRNIYSSAEEPDVIFTRASQDDYQQIIRRQEIDQLVHEFYNGTDKYFKIMQFDEVNVEGLIEFDFEKHQVYINYPDPSGESVSTLANYEYDENGIRFTSELTIAGKTVTRFDISQTVDTALNLTGSPLNDGIIYTTDLPDFEFKGAVDLFYQSTFFYVGDYSPSLDTLEQQIQEAGAFVIAQIYRDYVLSPSQRYNALTFLIFEETNDYDFYGFHISQYTRLGEDRIRFHWAGGRDSNITNELVAIVRNYLLFFFDQNGFKIIPSNDTLIFVSYANPKNYMFVVPVF
jgi:hypothetical protein